MRRLKIPSQEYLKTIIKYDEDSPSGLVWIDDRNHSVKIGSIAGSVLGIFSDGRLKENIKLVGTRPNGIRVYEYNYKGGSRTYRGPIAQDVMREHPELVHVDPATGYYKIPASLLLQ